MNLNSGDNFIVVGKGGVGKSSMTGGLATLISQKGSVLIADTDGSPSSIDVFGYDSSVTERVQQNGEIVRVRDKIDSLILGPIIPRILNDQDFSKLNMYMDTLLNGQEGLLPILRFILQPYFYGSPVEHKDFATILQLIELFLNDIYYSVNLTPGNEGIRRIKLEDGVGDFKIIDAENTSSFFDIVHSLGNLTRTLENMHKAMYTLTGAVGTKAAIMGSDNLKKFAGSSVVKNHSEAVSSFRAFSQLIETRTKVLMVTRPGITEFNQLKREIREMKERGFDLRNLSIVINFYKKAMEDNPTATLNFVSMLERFLAEEIGENVGMIKVDCDYKQVDMSLPYNQRKLIVDDNFNRVANCLNI